ncbi:TetR/AcrR family transcriptional regulator [Mycolicibacterium parafortuitum]|uniref:TetR family transcriptional regulator [Nocardia brasiliensis ATCC] n=1 Tax=Mycolicibacterium parafortuitum TaxID=39692 RepID=A0A375YFY8_MYCPF|nr:TetR/AcrR family transcriptional regulator [Mycolicibacterium parafortuitum]ORB28873.1 TetR family transcriptional regulator [Mycolicibacterium parafortuitum]SRX80010.1 TetR family transcriptional regulator [Nocardia brasiliensis ATCC] [Mycolicibacterium parafortuitum]
MAATADVRDARRRPKDRKQQIARASAEAFSELGYHAVSMEDIASRVGVTAASLYRHYSGKYDLFRAAVLGLGEQLVSATTFADDDTGSEAGATPEEQWERIVAALIDVAVKARPSGALYRWEARYLQPEDQATSNEQIQVVNRRLQRPLSALRPELDSRQRWTVTAAVLSAVGSICDHRAKLPANEIRRLLAELARQLRDADLPPIPPRDKPQRRPDPAIGPAGEYEAILATALRLFNKHGYRETGMDDIASAIGLPTSTIYRFFSGKAAILSAIYRRAADRVSSDMSTILAMAPDERTAVGQLIDAYVWRSFAEPELAYVYYAEQINVPAEDRAALHNIQRAIVESWARQVVAARDGLTVQQARFAVHAALGLVVDIGRLERHANTESSRQLVGGLLRVLLIPESR